MSELRLRRLLENKSTVQMARALGIAPATLSLLENREIFPSEAVADKLRSYFGRSELELLQRVDASKLLAAL
jgi:transcriptional regulator with XRE-family HTH domain